MSQDELDAQTSELLGRARSALSPTAADAARVLAGTMRVAAGASAGAGRMASWKLPLMAAAGAVLLALPGGYALGYRAGTQATLEQAPVALQPSAAVVVSPPAPRIRGQSSAEPLATTELSRTAPSPLEPEPERAPAARTRVLPAAPAPAMRPPAADELRTPSPASASNASNDLRRELDAIRRVELALREGHPRMALSILDRLDREIPQGQLHEERLASFAMARCAIGLGSRAALVREFAASYPESVYGERVARSCSEP